MNLKEAILFILLLIAGFITFSCEKEEEICACTISEITHDRIYYEPTTPMFTCQDSNARYGNDTVEVGDCAFKASY